MRSTAAVRDAVAWLARETGDDADAQRELLDAFGQARRDAGKGDAVDTLIDEILRQRGADYRRERLAALLARGDRDSLVALMLVIGDHADAQSRRIAAQGAALLEQHHAGDVLARYALALACSLRRIACGETTFARLVALAPDNAVHWIVAPPDATQAQTLARLQRAAQATLYDDHLAAQAALLRRSLPPTPAPAALRGMLDDGELAPSLLRHAVDAVPLPRYADIVRLCRPDAAPAASDASLRADCSAFAQRALTAPGASILSRMVAGVMLRRLHPDTTLAAQAYAYRRQYVWLSARFAQQQVDAEQLQQGLARDGEWEAWLRAADRAGIARMPPADWVPRDPQTLLLPEQRAGAR